MIGLLQRVRSASVDVDGERIGEIGRGLLVLVAVHRSSVTQADIAFLTGSNPAVRLFAGLRRPRQPIPGFGVAGVVVAVGEQAFGEGPVTAKLRGAFRARVNAAGSAG